MAPMAAVVKAASGSGRCSGNGEGSGGDQSEGNLAKHCVLQLSGARPLFRPWTSVGTTLPFVHVAFGESCFRTVSWEWSKAARTQRSTIAASRGPFYFAWGCFRNFVSRPCGTPPHSASKTRERAYDPELR